MEHKKIFFGLHIGIKKNSIIECIIPNGSSHTKNVMKLKANTNGISFKLKFVSISVISAWGAEVFNTGKMTMLYTAGITKVSIRIMTKTA